MSESKRYGSDVIADLLNLYQIEYVSLNPGASYRGLHDSIVNYAGNRPKIIECPHEEIAVAMAHGYAKATGKPMAAILHNVVGLLHSAMAIYYAYLDHAPVLVLGGGGPMANSLRRPRVDWDHVAVVQGNAVRDYVKWDDQPFELASVPESFARGYRIALTEPQGPVYICYDMTIQEDEFNGALQYPDPHRTLHTRLQADAPDLERAAEMLIKAERPVIVVDHLGRNKETVSILVELAELLAAPVIDRKGRFNFPNTHPLYCLDRDPLQEADLVLGLDVRDFYGSLAKTNSESKPIGNIYPDGCRLIEISTSGLNIRGWSQHSQRYQPVDLSILADTSVALPALLEACRRAAPFAPLSSSTAQREVRLQEWAGRRQVQRLRWREKARENWEARPMTPARMVWEVGEAIHGKDWVLTANTVLDWAIKLWDLDLPYRHPGGSLGTATQIGISLGVALAYKGTGKLVVDLQPDGDLMFDAGALWVAAHHQIPMLVVMYNNRSYYNDWNHQIKVARRRGRDEANAYLGMEIDRPAPDFAGLARSFGWYAEGPIEDGGDLQAAVQRAIRVIEEEGRPALVDAVTGFR